MAQSDDNKARGTTGRRKARKKFGVPVELSGTQYTSWIREKPKKVLGGEIELETNKGEGGDVAHFDSHFFVSRVLPPEYRDSLILVGYTDGFSGFKIKAHPKGYDYLLMGHMSHHGEFTDADGRSQDGAQPHFEEMDFNNRNGDGSAGKKAVVTADLKPGMTAYAFTESFLHGYHFGGKDGPLLGAEKPGEPSGTSPSKKKLTQPPLDAARFERRAKRPKVGKEAR